MSTPKKGTRSSDSSSPFSPKKGTRSSDSSSPFSPIKLPESPAALSAQKNLTGLPRVIRDIAADIYNSIQQWNNLHIKGANIINQIAVLKSNSKDLYPDGLEAQIIEMVSLINTLRIISNKLETCVTQLKSSGQLHRSPIPLFISWPVEKMIECENLVADSYKTEFRLKEFIVENICHLDDEDKIMFYAACWVHQPYISNEVGLALESFLIETGHRNIN